MQNSGSSSAASLLPGSRLGRYEIKSFVAAGGMGEVYRATDPTLNRDIAIKVLPAHVAADSERRVRFEREARMAAALNHPGIVTIHSVEHDGERVFITMELVQGKSLADLIPRQGFSIDRLLAIAVPLANAVSAAHDSEITHRDLKPANVMVGSDGSVKVLDFGIAKRHDAHASIDLASTASLATAEGHLLGTIAYMSPEQAEGKPADKRSDVFALGTMLYEMATGRRPFSADTSVATLAAIVRDAPTPIADLNPLVPRELARIIRRSLAKDPDRRQQSAKDLRNELDDLRRELESGELASAAVATPRRGVPAWLVGAAGIIAAIGATALWPRGDAQRDAAAGATAWTGITMTALTAEDGLELFPSLSPDGKWVVYTRDEQSTGQTDIFLRAVGGLTAINLTRDSPADDLQPAFSPDGERIVFRSERDGGGLFVMGRTGESVRRLTAQGFNPSWSPDGSSIVYGMESITTNPGARVGPSRELWTLSLTTGESRQVTRGGDAVQPSWSAHGQRIAFWGISGDRNQRDVWTVAAAGGEPVRVLDDAAIDWNPVWSADGRYLYFSSNRSGGYGLWRVAIDEASGRRMAEPEAVPLPRAGVAHFSFGGGGTLLAMVSLAFQRNLEGIAFDIQTLKTGARRRITNNSETGVIALGADAPSLSKDGQWLAFVPATFQSDLWVVRPDGSGLRQLTDDTFRDNNPSWFPDGKQLLLRSDRNDRFQAWTMTADGANLRQVTNVPGNVQWLALSPDGHRAAAAVHREKPTTLMFDPRLAAGQQQAKELPQFNDPPFYPTSWSPDGLRIAGWGGGRITVYSVATGEYQQFAEVSSAPIWPIWLPDNRTLVYSVNGELHSVDTKTNVRGAVLRLPAEFVSAPTLSPDGSTLYLNIIKPQGDIVLARLGSGTF